MSEVSMKFKKFSDICLISLAGAMLFGYGAAVFILPTADFSETENRPLTNLSLNSAGELTNGVFAKRVTDFYCDQFPMRQTFIRIKAASELLACKTQNNGIIIGKEGYLIPACNYTSYDTVHKNSELFSSLSSLSKSEGKPFFCAIAPRPIDVMTSHLPTIYRGNEGQIWETVKNREIITFTEPLRRAAARGEYVYYKTDHHWTARGAYYAYCELGESMNFSPMSEDFFTVSKVSDGFFGTSYSKAGGIALEGDKIELYRYAGDDLLTVKLSESGESFSGFYRYEALEDKDKYRVFLGGNYSSLTVTDGTDRKNLLLIKDSYANALIPFLALHYNITVLDLRYYTGDLQNAVNAADEILLLHGMDTIATVSLR